MTAQISDRILFQGKDFDLVGVKGGPLFAPQNLALHPVMLSTACYCGYYCKYKIIDDKLTLDHLVVGLEGEEKEKAEAGQGQAINGVMPKKLDEYYTFQYADIGLVVEFSGGMLIARKFIEELYVHMGYQDPWKFKIVHEFLFDKGILTRHHDRSKGLAEVRKKILARKGGNNFFQNDKDIAQWIRDCFSLKYD